jgi:hypothetical protein
MFTITDEYARANYDYKRQQLLANARPRRAAGKQRGILGLFRRR